MNFQVGDICRVIRSSTNYEADGRTIGSIVKILEISNYSAQCKVNHPENPIWTFSKEQLVVLTPLEKAML